jgi:hypothetical protein
MSRLDPRRRNPRIAVSRQGGHRHDPRPAHRRARPDRPLRPPNPDPPAPELALGTGLAGDVHGCVWAAGLGGDLTTQPQRAQRKTRSGRTGQTGKSRAPKRQERHRDPDQVPQEGPSVDRGSTGVSRTSRVEGVGVGLLHVDDEPAAHAACFEASVGFGDGRHGVEGVDNGPDRA